MKAVGKALSQLALVALGALVVVGVVALVTYVAAHPWTSAKVLLAVVLVALVVGTIVRRLVPRVPRGTIIELDLATMPAETGSQSRVDALMPNKPLDLHDVIDTLDRASRDKRVAGLILNPHFAEAPSTAIDELHAAVRRFADSGKFALAIADTFGEGDGSNAAYLLATACDEIVVQESGRVGLSQLSSEANFYPDLLARLGVEMEVFGRGKYKSAPNRFTQRKYTGPDREQRQRLLDNVWAHHESVVAQRRKLAPEVVRKLADAGGLLASEALDEGLIDRIAYPDQAIEQAKQRVGKKAKLLYLHLYKKRAGKGRRRGKTVEVAVIRAAGTILRESQMIPIPGLTSGPQLVPDKLVPQIRAAVKDKKVKAVVLRIDSPGGSALASDTIWRELERVREAGKPLVASMGPVAASGGYYIAAPADRIVASPTTITGSIGVFGMRPIIGGAKDKLDIHTDEVHTGKEAPISVNRAASRKHKQRIDVQLDSTYELFRQRVSDGRKMDADAVLEVAGGRVWTGTDAHDVGLVDDLGGLDRALEVAVELTGADSGTRAKVKAFPKKSKGVGMLRKKKGDSSDEVPAASASLSTRSLIDACSVGLGSIVAHLGCDPREFWIR
ncbi:MAG: protease [Actinomycetota bacterium]|jgi:protease-4